MEVHDRVKWRAIGRRTVSTAASGKLPQNEDDYDVDFGSMFHIYCYSIVSIACRDTIHQVSSTHPTQQTCLLRVSLSPLNLPSLSSCPEPPPPGGRKLHYIVR